MREANLKDYFECLKFHDKELMVANNKICVDDIFINLENEEFEITGTLFIKMLVESHYWVLAGVQKNHDAPAYVLAAGDFDEIK